MRTKVNFQPAVCRKLTSHTFTVNMIFLFGHHVLINVFDVLENLQYLHLMKTYRNHPNFPALQDHVEALFV
jgi:hypothetical protein